MATRMLIDARHQEETRVAVLKGNRIEEFDFESAEHKQIKGNIYLAKVTRVEPSLQAAFVDFGGNRHGFLAFSEIHPDYYQIPKEDREALIAEEAAHAEEEAALRADEDGDDYDDDDGRGDTLADAFDGDGVEEIDTSEKDDVATIEEGRFADDDGTDDERTDDDASDDDRADDDDGDDTDNERSRRRGRRQGKGGRGGQGGGSRAKEMDALKAKRQELRRRYKIQDVIQRRQVLLVQVVKEERGNKGAALTTYLSLAGRYTVLMPNSSHGGGISRKISSAGDRKRLKQIVGEMNLPRSMGLIVRTAGLQRTKTEIKRDFDYLARLWDEIRENTLSSSAPALIHSDSDLVKRAIRDIYNREIEEVVVEGENGYRSAKAFMKLLMPSHARRVKAYVDPVPLFQRFGAEDQLSAMYDPVVQLKSGGYLVINPTEALVSIDINSGRSTKEHGIEQTAVATNLEAAKEVARQLRLRDMAGLVVIDFIDMDYGSNVRKVEKCMKDALKNDRARIQVGRISGFGLMEMSRQRLRTGVLEATTRSCPHCDGTGLVRTASSAGLSALRLIEDEAAKGKGTIIQLFASTEAAVYLLNTKRADLSEIEERYGVTVEVAPEGEDEGAKMRTQSAGPRPERAPRFEPIAFEEDDDDEDLPEDEDELDEADDAVSDDGTDDESDDDGRQKRRRRRRGGRGRKRDDEAGNGRGDGQDDEPDDDGNEEDGDASDADDGERSEQTGADDDDRPKKRRRRGGRRRRGKRGGADDAGTEDGEAASDDRRDDPDADTPLTGEAVEAGAMADLADQLEGDIAVATGPEGTPETAEEAMAQAGTEPPAAEVEEEVPAKPKRRTRRKPAAAEADAPAEPSEPAADEKPKRRTRRKKVDPALDTIGDAPAVAASQAAPVSDVSVTTTPEEDATDGAATEDEPTSPAAPQADPADVPASDDNARPRRGWWQRTFGD